MAAYAFSRFNFWGKNVWFLVMLGTMMIPGGNAHPTVPAVLQAQVDQHLYPTDDRIVASGGAFSIFLLRQFVMSIPRDLDERAYRRRQPLRILAQ